VKLQIVQLEPQDDRASTRDRLRAVKADRVLLVWPRHGRILQRRLDLALLRREAESRGLELGLLTHDPLVRDSAGREHIPVFDNLSRLPEERWLRAAAHQETARGKLESPLVVGRDPDVGVPDHPDSRAPTPPVLRQAAVGLAALAFAALLITLVPSAKVLVSTSREDQARTVYLDLDSGQDASDRTGMSLTAQVVRAALAASDQAPATGRQSVPARAAEGVLQFTNLTNQSIDLPAGTSVRPSGQPDLYFVTVELVTLPAEEGGQALAAAAAAMAGSIGNLDAGQIDAVDGPLGLDVTVTNPEPFEGGTDTSRPAIRQQDLDGLRQHVLEALQTQAAERLRAGLTLEQRLALATVAIDQVLSENYDASPGDLAANVTLTMEVEATALAYRSADLEQAAVQAAERNVRQGWQIVPGSLQLAQVRSMKRSDGSTEVRANVTWRAGRSADQAGIRNRIAGLPVEDARRTIQAQPGVNLVTLEVWPTWFPRLPLTTARITVVPTWEVR